MSRHGPEVLGARWAAGLGGALLLGFAAVAAFGVYDKSRLASLETVSEPTAVGDKAFVAPASREVGVTVLTWNGVPLRLAELKNVATPDSGMTKAGVDDTRAFTIYKSSAAGDPAFYLKARDDEFLKVLKQ